jgi:transcriptional regulator with XRE-family HTH domain
VYKSFTGTTDENPADKYRRVAQEFNMTPHDVEAHINEMHRGSRLRLPFVISPEAAGLTPSEASGNIKKTMSDKEIYERRMETGISLQDLADELGLSREEIRQAEQRHMAELRRTGTPRSGGVVDDYEMRGMTSRRTGKNVSKKPTGSPRSIARDETLSMLSGGADGDSAMRAVAASLKITDKDTLYKLSKLNYRVAENAYDDNIDIGKMVRDEIPGNMDRSTRNDIVEALDEVAATIRESGGGSKKQPKKLSLTDEEIYDRRMNTGISLQDLAKELGVGRSDIRQAEQRHMAKLRKQTEVSGEVRGMPSRRRSGSTLLGRARRRNASISRVQTVPNAKPEKKKRAVAGAGFKKVGPNDGKFIESLSTEERQKAEDALKQLEKDIALELKGGKVKPTKKNPNPDPDSFGRQNFASYWRGQMAGAEKQRLKGGRFEPRPAQDQLTTSDITEMRLLLERDIASGKIPSVAVDAKTGQPKLNPDGTPAISPAEKIQRLLDDMQVLIGMRDKNQFEMVEHLHPESQKIVAQAATGKDKLRTSEMKKLGLGEESSFFGRAKGLEKGLAEISEENIKLSDTRQRFLRVNPERKRKRELRMARKAGKKNRRGRQLTEKDPLLALEQKKLRSLAARRELASKLRRKRDASKIEEKIQSNKSDGEKMIIRNPDGSVAVNKRFTSALAFVGREYKKDESKGAAERRKQAISNLWENTGFNNEPVLITKDEVQALLDAGWTPIVRGTGNERVKGEAYVEQFLTNPDRFVPGQGGEAHGFGEYFTDDPSSWGGYRGGSGDRHTILALIPPSAQVVDKRTLKQEQANMHKMADEMGRKVQELGGMDAAKKMTPEELAAELRNVLKGHEDKKDSVSHAILDNIISQLESVEREGGDSVRVKDDAIDALEFLRKASGTDEEGRFAPIVGVSLERSTGNVMLLHDRSAIAAVHVPLEDKEAQQLAKGIPSAKKLSKADKKARGIVDVSSWRQTGGQMGSNTAGVYEDPKGAKHYVKTPNSALQAENEVLASELYRMAGVQTPDVTLGTNSDGNLVVVSKMRDDIRNATQQADVDAVQDQFVTHAWLGNWDALLNNNTMIDGQGKPVLIDAGGSLLFRANAGRKGSGGSTPFGDVVGEMDSLRNPSINPQAARVFGKLTPDQIKAQVAQLRQITPDQIRKTVDRMISDMGERKKLADTLIARQQDIITRFG